MLESPLQLPPNLGFAGPLATSPGIPPSRVLGVFLPDGDRRVEVVRRAEARIGASIAPCSFSAGSPSP